MNFALRYKKIIEPVSIELDAFEKYFNERFSNYNSRINPVLSEYFSSKGKLLRPALIFILTRALDKKVSDLHFKLAFSDEMIHNATLIHDDIIDCSKLRRGQATLSFKYDSKLAVLAGDYLLSMALGALSSFEEKRIVETHSDSIGRLIGGEIEQYFERGELLSIDDYIEKSKNKTAELFRAGLCSACILNGNSELYPVVEQFALNFGVAFQIHNDLQDVISSGSKSEEDINNGIYTAPWIYYLDEKKLKKVDNVENSIKNLRNSGAIAKTRDLIGFYIDKAIENLECLRDNQYKQVLIDISRLYIEG